MINYYKKATGLAVCALVSASSLYAQQTVTGRVTAANGELSGVTISVVGTNRVTQTNANGTFTIPANNGEKLRISIVGYQTKEVTVSSNTINVTLDEDASGIDEVVVTAMGINKQERSLGYSLTKVDTEEIARTNSINIVNSLQGKVAGVNINAVGTSGVTSSSSITIRGAKSLDKNNSPIFVIDGIVMENNITDTYGGRDWGSQLKNLNPDDYASITVLKGAAATALYGSRGANGAIVITSKDGRGQRGIGVEVSQTFQVQNIYAPHIQLQNSYGAGSVGNGYLGGFLTDGNPSRTVASMGPALDGTVVDQYDKDGEKSAFFAHPDNWKALYQNGNFYNSNIALSGGGEKATFRVGYSRTDNGGVYKNNSFKRDALSFRTSADINKIITLDFGLNYTKSVGKNAQDQGFWRESQNYSLLTAYYMPRNLDLATFAKNYRNPENNAIKSQPVFGTIANFLHRLDYHNEDRQEESILFNLALKAQISNKIYARAQGNYNSYNTFNIRTEYGGGPFLSGGGMYGTGGNRNGNFNFLGMLAYEDKYMGGDLEFAAKIASELYGNSKNENWWKQTNGGLISPGLFAFANSVNQIIPSYNYTKPNYQVFGLFSVVNFGYKNQFFLELSARNDWNSSLVYPDWVQNSKSNWSVFYPSANASWVFTDTFTLPDAFSFGKIRASWSRVGMGTSAYSTSRGAGGFSQNNTFDQNRNTVISADPNIATIPNFNLKPEIQQSIELGADLRFINDRFGVDFTYYKSNTFNQILSLGNVLESGSSTRYINAGNIQNQGVELLLDIDPIRNDNLRWNVAVNYTVNRGKIKELHPEIKQWQLMGSADAGPEIFAYEGGDFGTIVGNTNAYTPVPTFFNNEADPNDPRNGMRIIQYAGQAGTPNPARVYQWTSASALGDNEHRKLGKIEADFIGGINTSLYYKGFDLYAQADGRFGGNFYSHSIKYTTGMGSNIISLTGRDQMNGGIARTNYDGTIKYDGIMLDAVFREGTTAPSKADPTVRVPVGGMTYREAIENGVIEPMKAEAYYTYNYGWGANVQDPIVENSWVMMREISLGYKLPNSVLSKLRMNYARIGLTGRNLFYIYNGLKGGLNPESIQSNNPLTPYEYGGVPFSRNFSLSLSVKF